MHRPLVIDDDIQMRTALYEVLKRRGYNPVAVANGENAISMLSKERFDVVITDVKMPGMDGIQVLRSVKRMCPWLPVLMMTAFGTIESAIEAIKQGAADYILKPFSPEILDSCLKKIIAVEGKSSGCEIVTNNGKMLDILDIAKGIAPAKATVLIMGESGTGKELLARFIHASSGRREKPFVAINCASIPDGLLESELFGYEKGAFTGAISNRKGKFEAANGGTILLDEIGEMGLHLQAKLLRVLQQREIDRLGGQNPVSVDIRVIATTNRDMRKEVEANRFREDLFYRLNVFPIVIPPLRERPDDIQLLAGYFLEAFCKRNGTILKGIREDAMERLKSHPWKGNVRELENVMERAALLCKGEEIIPDGLFYGEERQKQQKSEQITQNLTPEFICQGMESKNLHAAGTLRDMEKELICKVLQDTDGNKTRAAKALGISIRTLRNKLKEYGGQIPV